MHLGIGTSHASELETAAFVALELLGCCAPWLTPQVDKAMMRAADEGWRERLYCDAKLAFYLDIGVSTMQVPQPAHQCSPSVVGLIKSCFCRSFHSTLPDTLTSCIRF